MRTLRIGGTTLEVHDGGFTRTILPGGGEVDALPQDNVAYRQRSHELGYGDDTAAMSRDHEIAHAWLAHVLGLPESPTMRGVASGNYWPEWRREEAAVLAVQAFARAAGVDLASLAESREA